MLLQKDAKKATKYLSVAANTVKADAIHLFLLSPPLCGSTVIQQLICTSPSVTTFFHEGQWLPKARKILGVPDRWNSNLIVDWRKVRRIFYSYWSPFKKIRFEKSPPNIVRAKQIEQEFKNTYFLGSIRNPYALIEGAMRRTWIPTPALAAEFWVNAARFQKTNIESLNRLLFFTYEEITGKPRDISSKILAFLPQLVSLDLNATFTAHNITGDSITGL